jgi:lactose/cellobiose-specific phosphotransferase system IIC component
MPAPTSESTTFPRGRLWLTTVKDAFIVLMPLNFLGLIPLILLLFPGAAYHQAMDALWGPSWPAQLERFVNATQGLFGMALTSIIAVLLYQQLTPGAFRSSKVAAMVVGITAMSNFILLRLPSPLLAVHFSYDGMLYGIVIGIATAELMRLCTRFCALKMNVDAHEVDATYYYAMQLTTVVIAEGLLFFFVVQLLEMLPSIPSANLSLFVTWLQSQAWSSGWLLSGLATLISQSLMFFGIHGPHFLETYAPTIFAPWGTPYSSTLAWRPLFEHFTSMGGAGSSLCLVIAILMTTQQGSQHRVAKWSVVPVLFNINESLLYGLPLVLNGRYLLPFIGVPLVLTWVTTLAADSGLVHFLVVTMPWTTPPIISGWLLTGSWHGAALQVFEIGLGVALYTPFVRAAESDRIQREAAAVAIAVKKIADDCHEYGKYSLHEDPNGAIAQVLLADLRQAINTKDGALWLAYQPKHNQVGQVVGVEALIRWSHPLYGPISPSVMIALAESGQSIRPLGVWVLEQACACKARWNAMGYQALTMAVNVSPLQLEDIALASTVEKCLQDNGLSPSEIELEITESAAIPNNQTVEKTLHRLSEMGIRLSMDDFGMGYSSLLYLRRFQVHVIKIDGSLTRDVLLNATNADIVRTIATLGHSQKAEVVAEFVETLAQREKLMELGCEIFQGFYHSPALNEAQCQDYFSRYPCVTDSAHHTL